MRDFGTKLRRPSGNHVVMQIGHTLTIDSLFKSECESRKQSRHGQLWNHLDECLANADSLSSQEGSETVSVPAGALRGQVEWACGIKALWNELFGFLPLCRIVVQASHVYGEWIALAYGQVSGCQRLTHSYGRWPVDRGLHSKRLVEAVRIELQLRVVFVVNQRKDVEVIQGLAFPVVASWYLLFEMRLYDLFFKLWKNLVLVLGMLT